MSEKPVVVLIHGIRTAASWQNRLASLFETETGATVIPIKYGYFDLLRFLCPFGFCRRTPVEKLRQQLEGIAETYRNRPLIVFAHSFGTWALTRVIAENPFFRFDRVILCGSVVPSDFDWRRVQDQIRAVEKRNAIVNECGTRDVWPVIAQSVTWGYGSSGTYGFGTFNVRDRFHDIRHSDYFTDAFARNYWVPLVRGETVAFSDHDVAGIGSPGWFNVLRLPLKWLPAAALGSALAFGGYTLASTGMNACKPGETSVNGTCIVVTALETREEMDIRVSRLIGVINQTLDLKASELFPLMDTYVSVGPNDAGWQSIRSQGVKLLELIESGLEEIAVDKGKLLTDGQSHFFLVSNAKIPVGVEFRDALDEVRASFRSRSTIVSEMRSATELPSAEKMAEWKSRLTTLHQKLSRTLETLARYLRTA